MLFGELFLLMLAQRWSDSWWETGKLLSLSEFVEVFMLRYTATA